MLTLTISFEGKILNKKVSASFGEIIYSVLKKMRRKQRLVCKYHSDSHVKILKTKLNRDVILEIEIKSDKSFTSLPEIITMFNLVEFA